MSIQIQAIRELYARYKIIFSQQWARREELEPVPRLRHEYEFLPATLALQETPVHPAPQIFMRLILLFVFLCVVWSIFGKLDVVATAVGKIVPDSRSKIIQPMETASVRAIYVADGKAVNEGDVLIELDATIVQADIDRLRSEYHASSLDVAMYEARRMWLDKLSESEQHAASLSQELIKASSRGQFMRLTAPVAGTVQQLAVHTVGGVVTPAQPLMTIVPSNSPIEVEAYLSNQDIGFVQKGQKVEVKIETFSFTKYGTIKGEVVSVSSDAIKDEKLGLVFAVRVRLDADTILVDARHVRLSPGMAVTVEIKTTQRRVIEYFLDPLVRHGSESLHER